MYIKIEKENTKAYDNLLFQLQHSFCVAFIQNDEVFLLRFVNIKVLGINKIND